MALFSFLNLCEFINTIEDYLPNVFLWQVRQMPLKTRLAAIKDYECFLLLKERAKVNKLIYDEIEVISWLDNIVILKRLVDYFNKEQQTNLALKLEYRLKPSFKRIDAIIYQGKKLFILELSYFTNEAPLPKETKQVQDYALELMKIYPYSEIKSQILSFLPEYTQTKQSLDENIKRNNFIIQNIAKQIEAFFNN